MSVELALDFRANEARLRKAFVDLADHHERLTQILDASARIRDQLNTPLQILELDVALLIDTMPDAATRLARVRRTLDRLTDLGRRLQAVSVGPHTTIVVHSGAVSDLTAS
jgi:hypothetical protein